MNRKDEILVSWEYPHCGTLKFNMDGSRGNNGNATSGGVLRDDAGRWVSGFARNLGCATITFAELYAIFDALRISKRLHIQCLVVESDSIVAVDLVRSSVTPEHQHASLVRTIRQMLSFEGWDCQLRHVFREANGVADWLANFAHTLPKSLVEFDSCPPECIARFMVDMRGICFPSLVSS